MENQKNSLEVSLKIVMKLKIDIKPLKKHSLTLINKIHKMQDASSDGRRDVKGLAGRNKAGRNYKYNFVFLR